MSDYKKNLFFEILSNNPTGRYVYFNYDIEEENDAYSDSIIRVMDGNDQIITICGVGLDDENTIVILDSDNEEDGWYAPDEWTHAYLEMYQFVVENLKFAKQEPTINE